jgi:hypothetical protein
MPLPILARLVAGLTSKSVIRSISTWVGSSVMFWIIGDKVIQPLGDVLETATAPVTSLLNTDAQAIKYLAGGIIFTMVYFIVKQIIKK